MREKLAPLLGEKKLFFATISDLRDCRISEHVQKRVLLTNLILAESNEYLASHVWVGNATAFERFNLGDRIEFTATVSRYKKGGVHKGQADRSMDYGFRRIHASLIRLSDRRCSIKENSNNMRRNLKALNGQRLMFSAVVDGFGKRFYKDKEITTILFKDIRKLQDGILVTDHLWFTQGKCWSNMTIGQRVQFEARVKEYEKGYKGLRQVLDAPVRKDYKLERPTKIELL